MIGILLPLTALGLMLQPPLNARSTTSLSAPGTGTRAVVPLRMADEFDAESVEDLETKIEEAAEKMKVAVGRVENKVEDAEDKITEIEAPPLLSKNQIAEAFAKIAAGRPEEVRGLTNRQVETLNILKFFNLPVIAGVLLQFIDDLLQKGREGVEVPVGNTTVVVTTDFLSSLWEFDAEFDLLLLIASGKLIRRKAQTWDNVTSPNCETKESIETSYEWSHEFFPNLRTRGFDPTLRPDGNQLPAGNLTNSELNELFAGTNALANEVFANKSAEALQTLTRKIFNEGLPMTPEAQGVWNDKWAGKRDHTGEEFFQRVIRAVLKSRGLLLPPFNAYKVESSLSERTKWLTTQYFDTTEEKLEGFPWATVSQDMSLRYLGNWDVGDNGSFTDEMFSQFYMAGIGQSFVYGVDPDNDIQANGATFVADNDWCSLADVLEGQGKYGGKVYFDDKGAVTHIVYEDIIYRPDDKDWEFVKMKCRSTVLMLLTALEHLLGVHLSFSNSLSMATPKLPTDHALRRLLWPHIFNGIGVNRKAAATLSLEGGLFTRGWRMTLDGVHTAYAYVADKWDLFKFQTPIELKAKRNLGEFGDKMPLYEDGIPFYNVTRDYVGKFVDLHYPDDNAVLADVHLRGFYTDLNDHLVNRNLPFLTSRAGLSDVLATYIYYVTGYHTHAGTAHAEAAIQGVAPSSFYADPSKDQHGTPPDAAVWSFFTYVGTASLTLPITGDTKSTEWKAGFKDKASYFWLHSRPAGVPPLEEQPGVEAIGYPEAFKGHPKEQAINKAFAQNLINLQGEIIKRNIKRNDKDPYYTPAQSRVYNCFDINFVESGVAI